MKQILFFTFLLLASCVQNSNKSENSTSSDAVQEIKSENDNGINTALAFINGYIENEDKTDIIEWVNSNETVTQSFKSELKRMMDEAYKQDPEMGLGYDPILNAQDYPDEGFELDSFDSENGYLTAKGKEQDQFKVTIKIVKEDNKWLIDGCGIINIPDDKR